MPRLSLRKGGEILREVALDKGELTVGRRADSGLMIDDKAVSARHCRIVRDGDGWAVEDLGSTNGTKVNGLRVERARLKDGDTVGVARHEIVFVGAEAAPAGTLKVLSGPEAGAEHVLSEASTYVGDSDRAHIRVKGSLLSRVPEVAFSLHRRAEGYVLVAVADGYPVLNGSPVSGQAPLKDGDTIECGSAKLRFVLKKP